MAETKTPGWAFYDKQMEYIYATDVDGLIENHYTEDAQLIGFDFVVRGKPELKEHFREYLKNLPGLRLQSTDKFQETDDTIFFEATVTTDHGTAKVYDAFVLRGGKVTHHFTGLISFTPKGA